MSNRRNKQSIDAFYESKVQEGRIDFDPKAWEAMEHRLDNPTGKGDISEITSIWRSKWIPIVIFTCVATSLVALVMFSENDGKLTSNSNTSENVIEGVGKDEIKEKVTNNRLKVINNGGGRSDLGLKEGENESEVSIGKEENSNGESKEGEGANDATKTTGKNSELSDVGLNKRENKSEASIGKEENSNGENKEGEVANDAIKTIGKNGELSDLGLNKRENESEVSIGKEENSNGESKEGEGANDATKTTGKNGELSDVGSNKGENKSEASNGKEEMSIDAGNDEDANNGLKINKKGDEVLTGELTKEENNPKDSIGNEGEAEKESNKTEMLISEGGNEGELKNKQPVQIDSETNLATDKETFSKENRPNTASDSTNEKLTKESQNNNTEIDESIILDENIDTNEGTSQSQNSSTMKSSEVKGVGEKEILTAKDKIVGPILNEGEVYTKSKESDDLKIDRTIDFPFLPMSQFELERNESINIDGESLMPKGVEVLSKPIKGLYVKVGYGDVGPTGINRRKSNVLMSIGQDIKRTGNGSYGVELAYERFRNDNQTNIYIGANGTGIGNFYAEGGINRDFVELRGIVKLKPIQKRWSMTSNFGLGLESTSWDLRSTVLYPSSSVIAAENSNRIYMKPAVFLALGGDIGYDIIRNSLSFHVGVNYQYRLQDVEVNGTLQGYRINASEYERAYETIEERVLREENYITYYAALKFYLF